MSPARPQESRHRPSCLLAVTSFGHPAQCPQASFLRVLSPLHPGRNSAANQPARPSICQGTKMSLYQLHRSPGFCRNKPLTGEPKQQESFSNRSGARSPELRCLQVVPPAGAGGGSGLSLSQSHCCGRPRSSWAAGRIRPGLCRLASCSLCEVCKRLARCQPPVSSLCAMACYFVPGP